MAATSQPKEKFNDYEAFVEKFKPKKTTDDCYTPQPVYDALLKWIDENIMPLSGVEILRPFYPGGDYENFDYPPGAVVIDNPPFSMISKICRFYQERGIKYFLFAPHLTLFSSTIAETYVVASAHIIYENGAYIATSFLTNMVTDGTKIMLRGDLNEILELASKRHTNKHRKISYPVQVISAATLGRLCTQGIIWHIPASELHPTRKLDNTKGQIFGRGFYLSERAAAERAAAERAAAERAAAEKIELSDREWQIIKSLGQK